MASARRTLSGLKRTMGQPYRAAISRISRRLFERGADTSRWVELSEFGLADPERTDYEPSGWLDLRRALRMIEVSPTDVFLDIGSGMGRIVQLAARKPFARVIGVEISPELNESARANLGLSRDRLRCGEVEIATSDAASYEIPNDVTIVYIFNPFGGELFKQVISNLLASIDRNPRTVTLIYRNPLMADALLATGRFVRVSRSKGLRRDVSSRWIDVYESRSVNREGVPV